MKGAATRAAICAKGRWARSRLPSRADRLNGEAGARPNFAALAGWPAWLALPDDERQRVGTIAALLDAREALVDEIDGAKLRAYADVVGDDALEAIIAAESPGRGQLLTPEHLARISSDLLAASLEADAAVLAQIAPQHRPAAAALVQRAEVLSRRIPQR